MLSRERGQAGVTCLLTGVYQHIALTTQPRLINFIYIALLLLFSFTGKCVSIKFCEPISVILYNHFEMVV